MIELSQILSTWKKVFSNWKYVLIFLFAVLIFYSLNILIFNWKNLATFYSNLGFFGTLKLFFSFFFSFRSTIVLHSFISLILISILFGVLISLIFYKSKLNISKDKRTGLFGGIGVFIGAFVPGCAACGVGLASFLGLGAGFLSFLPYDGLELSILSIVILGFAIINLTKNMYTCKVK